MTKGEFFQLLAYASVAREDLGRESERCIEEAGIVAGSQTAIINVALTLATGNLSVPYQIALMEVTWEKNRRPIELANGRIPCSLIEKT